MPYQVYIFVDYKAYGKKPFKKPKKIIQLEKELGFIRVSLLFFRKHPIRQRTKIVLLAAQHGVCVISTTFGLLSNDTLSVLRKNILY